MVEIEYIFCRNICGIKYAIYFGKDFAEGVDIGVTISYKVIYTPLIPQISYFFHEKTL
jgi:hypothetical protein